MKTLPIIEEFLDYLETQRNFSAHTIRCYAADLVQFCRFLLAADAPSSPDETPAVDSLPTLNDADAPATEKRLLAVTPVVVRAFLAAMRNREYSKATVARKLATLRSFYKSLVRLGRLDASPVSVIRTPRQSRPSDPQSVLRFSRGSASPGARRQASA